MAPVEATHGMVTGAFWWRCCSLIFGRILCSEMVGRFNSFVIKSHRKCVFVFVVHYSAMFLVDWNKWYRRLDFWEVLFVAHPKKSLILKPKRGSQLGFSNYNKFLLSMIFWCRAPLPFFLSPQCLVKHLWWTPKGKMKPYIYIIEVLIRQ